MGTWRLQSCGSPTHACQPLVYHSVKNVSEYGSTITVLIYVCVCDVFSQRQYPVPLVRSPRPFNSLKQGGFYTHQLSERAKFFTFICNVFRENQCIRILFFLDMTLCNLASSCGRFEGLCCCHKQGSKVQQRYFFYM